MPAEPDRYRDFFKQTVLFIARTVLFATVLLVVVVYVM